VYVVMFVTRYTGAIKVGATRIFSRLRNELKEFLRREGKERGAKRSWEIYWTWVPPFNLILRGTTLTK